MKPHLRILPLIALTVVLSCCHKPQVPPEEPQPEPVETPDVFDYSVLDNAPHPRLMMTEDDFTDLKRRLGQDKASNQTLCKIHHAIIVKAQAYASAAQITSDPSSHENNVAEILALCYAWRTTGNVTFLSKLLKDIDAAIAWKDLGSGLAVGEQSLALAVAYDWIYGELSQKQRDGISNLLVDKAIKGTMKASFRSLYGNWNQVGNGGVMSAALAVYENDNTACKANIETGLVDNSKVLRKIMAGGGGYPEGTSYWNYGMTYQAVLLESMLTIFSHTCKITEIEGLMDSGMYALMSHGTMNTVFSYADGGSSGDQPMLASWWYAARKNDASLAFAENHLLDEEKYISNYARLTPLVPAFLKSFNPDEGLSRPPETSVWHCHGEMPLCIVRRGWTYSPSDIYLGIKGGNCNTWRTMSTSHGHMDAGSFVFEAEGVRWSDDVMRPSYSKWFSALENAGSRSGDTSQGGLRWSTFNVNALCHSTIVSYTNDGSVKGKLHPSDQYVDGHASILEVHDEISRQGAVLDMSGPMKGQAASATRSIHLLADGTLEVADMIQALDGMPCQLEWRMLSISNASVQSGGIRLTSQEDSGISRTLSVTCSDSGISPTYATWATAVPSDWTGFTYYQTISKRVIAGWKATVPAGKTVTFTTILKKD